MSNFSSSKMLKFLITFLLRVLFATTIFGQSLFIEEADSTVIVQRDNLVKAKAEALKDAKSKAILQAIGKFLDFDSIVSLKPLLRKHFLEKPDFFIESIRVISEGNNSDLTEFTLKIETQIFRSRLLSTFNQLGLPTQKELTSYRNIFLIYDTGNFIRNSKFSELFLEKLQTRLNSYLIRTNVIIIDNNNSELEDGLPARLKLLAKKTIKKKDVIVFPLLELKLRLSTKPEHSQQGKISAQLIFWSQQEGIAESSRSKIRAEVELNYNSWQVDEIIQLILDKLTLKWTPIVRKTLEMYQGSGRQLNLKFKGIPGPLEEQLIIKTLFKNKPHWKKLSLSTISNNYITYQAIFLGKRESILKDLSSTSDAPFRITSVYWDNNYLVVELQWEEIPAPLEKFKINLLETGLVESNYPEIIIPKPNLQVPLRTLKKTYILPLYNSVFDHIRHRGDSTLFMIETPSDNDAEKPNIVHKLSWSRLGKTNLRPKITLFDQNLKRLNYYYLGKKKNISLVFELPEASEKFFLRISDEVGFLKHVAGSYQSFRYVLRVD